MAAAGTVLPAPGRLLTSLMDVPAVTIAIVFTASLLMTRLARRLAVHFGAIDRPDGQRKLHQAPVPVWGGIAVYLAFLVGGMISHPLPIDQSASRPDLSWVLLFSAGCVCLLGGIDDSLNLNGRLKLLLQGAAVIPIILAGYYVDRIEVFGHTLALGWWGIPLTVLWLLGCINAMNLLDGMDGMASVVGMIAAAAVAAIAYALGHYHVGTMALLLAAALAGFLIHNLPPATIYLGDSGSTTIGVILGVLSLQAVLTPAATVHIAGMALVLAVPLLDTTLAIVRRKLTGRRFDAADRGHIHHRMLERGLTIWQALLVAGSLGIVAGAAAISSILLRSDLLAVFTGAVLVAVLVQLRLFGHYELALAQRAAAEAASRLAASILSAIVSRQVLYQRAAPRAEEVWSSLVAEAQRHGVERAELVARKASEEPVVWRWQADGPSEAGPGQPALTIEMPLASRWRGTLRLVFAGPSPVRSRRVVTVVALFQAFLCRWGHVLVRRPKKDEQTPGAEVERPEWRRAA